MTGPPDDVAALAEEFPAWDFAVGWVTANSGRDARVLYAWPLDGGPTLTAPDAEQMRRKVRLSGPGGEAPPSRA